MALTNYLYLALIFIAVATASYGIGLLIGRPGSVRHRLRDVEPSVPGTDKGAAGARWRDAALRAAKPISRLAATSEAETTQLRTRFMQAGFRHASAPVIYFAAKAALAVFLPLAAVMFVDLKTLDVLGLGPIASLLGLAAIGYYLPNGVLARLVAHRRRELFESFPDAVDLIIVCVEAGLSLDMAIARAAQEMELRSPALAEELKLVGVELRIGATRERALRNLATRSGVEEMSSFVAMMLQADRFGTSIADSLRVQADALRTRRRLRAEEAAAKLPVKLLFPLVFCIFPSLLLVLLGPAMIQVARVLFPMMTGN